MKEYQKDFIIDYKDVDRYLYLRLDAVVQMLNTLSMYHTVNLGMEPDYMEKRGLVWVLYQWRLNLAEGRYYAQKLTFRTFAVFQKEIYSHRYFHAMDEAGNVVGTALSIWIVIDQEKRKMVKIPPDIQAAFSDRLHPALSPEQQTLVDQLDTSSLRRRKDAEFQEEKKVELRFTDIDSNGHVNNTVYVGWAVEALKFQGDETFLETHVPQGLSIIYKKEKLPGGAVVIRTARQGQESYHEILDEEGCLLSILELSWKTRP